LGVHWLFLAPIGYVFYKFKLLSLPLMIVMMAIYLFSDPTAFLAYSFSLVALSFVLFFGIHAFRIAQENILRKTVKAKDLEEGMIPAENVYIGGIKVADTKMARGLLPNEIEKIKRARKEMKIKLSIPFVPVITLGLIILLVLEKVIK
jgi:prepilin signal peptidase PulO-like enzyme (type II secretory pathway)